MREWLTIELLLVVLLSTSFTCVGMVALGAAVSPRHWFIRTSLVILILSPLLLVPAYEVFALFVIESAIIAFGVTTYRRSFPRPRFSLSDAILATALLAVGIAIAVRMPSLNHLAWATVALNGLVGGLSTLVGMWLLVGQRKWIVWPAAFLCCISIGFVLSMLDWFIPSFVNWTDWPPEPNPAAVTIGNAKRPVIAWFFVPILTMFSITMLSAFWCATSHAALRQRSAWKTGRLVGMLGFVFLAATYLAMPIFILLGLLFPDPIPKASLPSPNGYDDLVAAGNMASNSAFNSMNFDYEIALQPALAAEVAKCKPIYERVAAGVSREVKVPVNYDSSEGSLAFPEIQNFRAVSRAIAGKARLAQMEGHLGDSTQSHLDGIAFGQAIVRDGLLIDALVGNACAGISMYQLYQQRDQVPAQSLVQSITRLQEFDAAIEPYNDIWYRDRVWSQRTNGWHGHLTQLLGDIVEQTWDLIVIRSDQYLDSYDSHRAKLRLLIVELVLRRFHEEQVRWPGSIEELAPIYLSAIPTDPFDPTGRPLKYRKTDTGFIAYSVGPNRIDDGGAPPNEDDSYGLPETGDLRLDIAFKPDELAAGGNSSDSNESQSETAEISGDNPEAPPK